MSKALDVLHVKELVHETRGQIFADSLTIADKFGKQHKNVIRDVEKLLEIDENFGSKVSQSFYLDNYNREQKMYQLDRDAFVFLVTKFTGKKVQEWQWHFIEAFNTMEQMVLQKQNQEWLTVRHSGKSERKELGDILKCFIEYCKAQGSQNADRYYGNITSSTYKALELIKGKEKVPSQFRDMLSTFDLASLAMAERIVQGALSEGIVKQMYYKDIYQFAKEKVLIFASSIKIAKITNSIGLL